MSRAAPPAEKRWTSRGESSLLLPFVLGCVDRCARPVAALGVDPVALREILRVKLLLDLRGGPPAAASARATAPAAGDGAAPPAPRGGSLTFGLALVLSAAWMAGLLPAIVGLLGAPAWVWMTSVSGMTMGLVGFLVFMQSVTWVMDTTDIGVISSRPVSDRTLFAARLAHIGTYVALVALALMFWPLALGSIRYPWWAVLGLVPVTVGLSALLAVSAVGSGFALLLRLAGPRHFQRLTLWVQILGSMLAMGGFQLVGAASGRAAALALRQPGWLHLALPPFHFGGLFAWVLGERTDHNLLLAALALALPPVLLAAGLLLASRHFIAGLSGALTPVARPSIGWSRGLFARAGRHLLRTDAERAGYEFTLAMSRRDRLFIRTAWPMLGGMLVMALAMVLSLRNTAQAATIAPWFPFALYMLTLAVPGVLDLSRLCETPDARWLFRALPVSDPRQLLRGGVMALLCATILPMLLGAALVVLLLAGLAALPDVLLALELVLVLVLFAARRMELHLPFSAAMQANEFNATNIALILGMMLLAALGAGAHLALRLLVPGEWRPGVWLGVVLAAWLLVRAWRELDHVQLVDSETGKLWKPPGRRVDPDGAAPGAARGAGRG